jgi:hypothetical protein
MRDLGILSVSDPFWDPDSVVQLSSEQVARKFGQTSLSRLAYHRRKVRGTPPLRLSQQLGILLWLNRNDLLSTRGEERLLFLQSKAPWGQWKQEWHMLNAFLWKRSSSTIITTGWLS